MHAAKLTKPDSKAILSEGAYFVLDDYALRDELRSKFESAILDGVERLAGQECRKRVSSDGLGQLHRHFPIQKLHRLEAHLMRRLRDDLYYWSYRVGADTLGLSEPFYVVHLIVFRIHYPYLIARAARDIEHPPVLWGDRARLAFSALRDWRMWGHYLPKSKGTVEEENKSSARFDPLSYHGEMAAPARSHGPHIDTWYGHSYDGINLWLSIEGVNEQNTVILYPDMFGRPLAFDPVSMYLAPGIALSKPHKIDLKPGQLLVFNPETLHATQVNISDETRVALTTRINPAQPRFAPAAPFHFEHWYSSEDLRQQKFDRIRLFPSSKFEGQPSVVVRPRFTENGTTYLRKDERLETHAPLAICASDALRAGKKMAVDLSNAKLVLWRHNGNVRAFSRICPHVGVDLADGSHDESQVFCPGHGVAFSLSDGTSKCSAFKLRPFRAFEKEGIIYVARVAEATAVSRTEGTLSDTRG